MALLPRITAEQLQGLHEEVRKEYVQRGELYYADITPTDGWALEDVGGLKTALQKERLNVQASESKLAAFADIDPAAARDALSKVGEMADWTPEKKVQEQIAAEKKQLETRHATELTKLTGEKTGLLDQLNGHIVNSAATAAIAKSDGIVDLLLPIVQRSVKVEADANGKLVARVIGEDGNARISMKQGDTGYMGIEEFVGTLRESATFAPAFKGTGKSGTGSSGSGGGGGTGGPGTGTPGSVSVDPSSGTLRPTDLDQVAEFGVQVPTN